MSITSSETHLIFFFFNCLVKKQKNPKQEKKPPEMIINGLLLYLSNCASLLASPRSITWQVFLTASPQVCLLSSRPQQQTPLVQTLSSNSPFLLLRVNVSLCFSPPIRLRVVVIVH